MDEELTKRRAETDAHARLKRLSLLWAQAQGYTACAVEVSLPRSRLPRRSGRLSSWNKAGHSDLRVQTGPGRLAA